MAKTTGKTMGDVAVETLVERLEKTSIPATVKWLFESNSKSPFGETIAALEKQQDSVTGAALDSLTASISSLRKADFEANHPLYAMLSKAVQTVARNSNIVLYAETDVEWKRARGGTSKGAGTTSGKRTRMSKDQKGVVETKIISFLKTDGKDGASRGEVTEHLQSLQDLKALNLDAGKVGPILSALKVAKKIGTNGLKKAAAKYLPA